MHSLTSVANRPVLRHIVQFENISRTDTKYFNVNYNYIQCIDISYKICMYAPYEKTENTALFIQGQEISLVFIHKEHLYI